MRILENIGVIRFFPKEKLVKETRSDLKEKALVSGKVRVVKTVGSDDLLKLGLFVLLSYGIYQSVKSD